MNKLKIASSILFIVCMLIGVFVGDEALVMYGGFLLVWNEVRSGWRDEPDEVEEWI